MQSDDEQYILSRRWSNNYKGHATYKQKLENKKQGGKLFIYIMFCWVLYH